MTAKLTTVLALAAARAARAHPNADVETLAAHIANELDTQRDKWPELMSDGTALPTLTFKLQGRRFMAVDWRVDSGYERIDRFSGRGYLHMPGEVTITAREC